MKILADKRSLITPCTEWKVDFLRVKEISYDKYGALFAKCERRSAIIQDFRAGRTFTKP